jgi:hypothetical protein
MTAVLIGGITGWCVGHWPNWPRSPLWQNQLPGVPAIQVLGFSRDGTVLHTLHRGSGMRICDWETKTGKLCRSLDILGSATYSGAELAADGSSIVVYNDPYDLISLFSVHELDTGRRRFGPLGDVSVFVLPRFSADGRWCWYARREHTTIVVLDARNGEQLLELRGAAGETSSGACFSPDGNALAVLWTANADDGDAGSRIEIIELPSSQIRLRQPLPTREWRRIRAWRADRIYLTASTFNSFANGYDDKTFSFHLNQQQMFDERWERLLDELDANNAQIRCIEGDGWIARAIDGWAHPAERKRQQPWRRCLTSVLGIDNDEGNGVHLSFCDPVSGDPLSEFPSFAANFVISPDGKHVGWAGDEGIIEVWDSAPPKRWPWPIAAGLVMGGASWFLVRKPWLRFKPRRAPQLVSPA